MHDSVLQLGFEFETPTARVLKRRMEEGDNCSAGELTKIIRLTTLSDFPEDPSQAQQQDIINSSVLIVSEDENVGGEAREEQKQGIEAGCGEQSPIPVGLRPSRRKLLVLDLNGLLADIVCPPPKDAAADINIARRAVFVRPSYFDFLRFCFERFEVGVWSSRSKKNVNRITDFLFKFLRKKLLFCWDTSYCTISEVGTLENKRKYVVFKELRKLWEKEDPSLPWEKGDYNESNTLLLDDSPYKALLNPPHTAILPHSYQYHNQNDNSLSDGGDLRVYLERLAAAENVQEFVKKNPFGQEAISETSESWNFYSDVIANLRSKEAVVESQ